MTDTIFACDALGDLYQYNEQLLRANKELLARCDLLGAELAALKEAARPVAKWWRYDAAELTVRRNVICANDAAQLDTLAALVGEG